MAQRKSNPRSSGASDPQERDSVYDFLYHDARRIGSFLGQFNPDGHLQGLQTRAETGRSRGSKTAGTGTIGVPLTASGSASHEQDEGQHWDRSAQRTYDPLWANARAFLDYLETADLIEREPNNAAIGQFILISGRLFVVDTRMLKSLSDGPLFRKNVIASTKPAAGPRQAKSAPPNPQDVGLEMLSSIPWTVQARMATDAAGTYWGTLLAEGLASSPGDLMLKHGIQLAGEWSILGILDAIPSETLSEQLTVIQNAITLATLGPMIGGLGVMADVLRPILGRPSDAYGITPLLVFREVAARA